MDKKMLKKLREAGCKGRLSEYLLTIVHKFFEQT